MVLLDVVNGGCIAVAGKIKERKPRIKIILMVGQPEYSYLVRAHKAGADSFWYKRYPAVELFGVMERTAAGESIYPSETPPVQLGNIWSTDLSKRELEVLRWVVAGDTDAIIAERLFITVPTVKSHVQNIKNRTGFRNRTEIAVKVRESGLVIPWENT
jgi:two-component system vancomycin resistance associated response regulator VraR